MSEKYGKLMIIHCLTDYCDNVYTRNVISPVLDTYEA